ncbi:hypothetical protein TWF718_005667 [Orbilia javanica]|uniref:Uncharacterized protein n=1 Tax=Orbilia javanica TaxID=47235 RepID=A0AAN8RED1_9PEZI
MSDKSQENPKEPPTRKENKHRYRKYGPLPHTPFRGKCIPSPYKEAWQIKLDDPPPTKREKMPEDDDHVWVEDSFFGLRSKRFPPPGAVFDEDNRYTTQKGSTKNSPKKDKEEEGSKPDLEEGK